MPGGDRTGPAGMGPMTGRAAGYCAGNIVPGCATMPAGRGMRGRGGRGGGGGRGWRNRFFQTGLTGWQRAGMGYSSFGVVAPAAAPAGPYPPGASSRQQLEVLQEQARYFEGALADIRTRIEELQAEGGKD